MIASKNFIAGDAILNTTILAPDKREICAPLVESHGL